MYKLFSIKEANSLIPEVEQALEDLRTAASDLRDITKQVRSVEPYSVEARNLFYESTYLAKQVHEIKQQLTELGLQLVNPETGKLGFPGQIGAEVVYLTWEPGEKSVSHFHRVAGGSAEAVPISSVTQKPDPGSALA